MRYVMHDWMLRVTPIVALTASLLVGCSEPMEGGNGDSGIVFGAPSPGGGGNPVVPGDDDDDNGGSTSSSSHDDEDCNNGSDDDGDGWKDCADQDCFSHASCQDGSGEICDNNTDDDGDGFKDCLDQDCWGEADCDTGDGGGTTPGDDDDDDVTGGLGNCDAGEVFVEYKATEVDAGEKWHGYINGNGDFSHWYVQAHAEGFGVEKVGACFAAPSGTKLRFGGLEFGDNGDGATTLDDQLVRDCNWTPAMTPAVEDGIKCSYMFVWVDSVPVTDFATDAWELEYFVP